MFDPDVMAKAKASAARQWRVMRLIAFLLVIPVAYCVGGEVEGLKCYVRNQGAKQ